MSFDSHSLERLRELGRKLPQKLPKSKDNKKSNQKNNPKLHPIETEENPNQLFRELINASSNGEIPPHLIERLKEIESLQKENLNSISKSLDKGKYSKYDDDPYIPFKQLLLEEEQEEDSINSSPF